MGCSYGSYSDSAERVKKRLFLILFTLQAEGFLLLFMQKKLISQINAEGKLFTAVLDGGDEVLWRLAARNDEVGKLAGQVLERFTKPNAGYKSSVEAILEIMKERVA